MWNVKGFGSRESYNFEGLQERVNRLAKDTASATGITAKRLRLLASLDRLQGFSDADYSKNNSDLKAAGISSKFVRNCILKGGLEAQISVEASLVQPLSNAVMEKITAASVNEKKFNTKYLSVLDNLHAQLPPATDNAGHHLPAVDSVISGRMASLNRKNEESEKASIATVYSSHKDGFAKDLAEVGVLKFEDSQVDLTSTVDTLVNHLIALPKDKNGNRLKDILSLLKNAASQAQSDSSEPLPVSIKDLRPHLFNKNGTGVSLYEILLPESEHGLPPQVQQIFKALRQKYITPHSDNELNQLIIGNQAFIEAHEAQVPPLGAAWQDFFPQYAASAGGLATIKNLVSIAESARGDAQNTMVTQLVDNAAALPPALKHAYAALSLGMHQNIANDSGLRLLRNESIAQVDLDGLEILAKAPVNRSSHAGSSPEDEAPTLGSGNSDSRDWAISERQGDAEAEQPLGRWSNSSSFRSAKSSSYPSESGAFPQSSGISPEPVGSSEVASEVAPSTVKAQRQAWLGALKTSVDSSSSKLILSVPTRVSYESRGSNSGGVSTGLTGQTNGVRHQSSFSGSYSEQQFVTFLWNQVPEALKGGNDGVGFESLFKAAARGLFNKLCTLEVGAAQINTDSQQVLEFIVSENSIEIEKKPVPKPEDKSSTESQLPFGETGALPYAIQRRSSEGSPETVDGTDSDEINHFSGLPAVPNIQDQSQSLPNSAPENINLTGNQLLEFLAARCGELATLEQGDGNELEQAHAAFLDAQNLVKSKISDLTKKFEEKANSTALEKQREMSCGIHSINNLFSRPGLVGAMQVLQLYEVMVKAEAILDCSKEDENKNRIPDGEKRSVVLTEISRVLSEGLEDNAHKLISSPEIRGIEINGLSTLLNSWVVPAANSANIPVGEFQNMQLAALVDTACFGKRMIAHRPGHYFAVAPVPSKETNGANTPLWEVRDSQGPQRIQLSGFNALKKYLEDQKVGNVLLES